MSIGTDSARYEAALATAHRAVWRAEQAAAAVDRLEEAEDLHGMVRALTEMGVAALKRPKRRLNRDRVDVSDAA
jgi:hypothetical protein